MTLKRNMCDFSTHTCGACLAKWSGQSWEETYKGILPLETWTLVLNKSFQLCIEGRYNDYGLDLIICIPVKKRVNSHWVANERTLIKLHGPLFSKDLPDFVVSRFSDGIPENWELVTQMWAKFIGHGENSSFSLNLNDTLMSDSSRGSRNRRNIVLANKGGKGTSQRTASAAAIAAAAATKQQSSDSAFQSVQSSSAAASKLGTTHPNWVSPSPWLPPHKVKEITQWMNRSPVTPHIPPDPLSGLESEPGDGGSLVDLHLDGLPPGGASTTATSSTLRLSAASRLRELSGSLSPESNTPGFPSAEFHRPRNNAMTQSTPLSGTQDIRPSANPINLSVTMSSISHMDLSSGMTSFESIVPRDDLFRKPMQDAHGIDTPTLTRTEMKTPVTSDRLVSKPTPSSRHVNQRRRNLEAPGAEIGRMENSPRSRPMRKHSPQKIERWRPTLGVDGNVKLQGYLVLRGDMTAGQILTTNSVVEWLGTKVTTCDKREYELIGDMYDPSGKISAFLRRKLKKAMKCSDIQEALQETQALRDDVTCFSYLAPPPAPEKTCTTRSGRVCRPRAPYWLNRSDWGAEYDIFYHDTSNPEKSSCSFAKTPTRSSARRNNSNNNNQTTTRRRNNNNNAAAAAAALSPQSSTSSPSSSPARKSLRLQSHKAGGPLPRPHSHPQQQQHHHHQHPHSGKTDYVMHVSASRIKVSYPSKAAPLAAAAAAAPTSTNNNSSSSSNRDATSVRCRPQQSCSSVSTPPSSASPSSRSRTPRCPAKLSCDTCCGGGGGGSPSHAHPTTTTTTTTPPHPHPRAASSSSSSSTRPHSSATATALQQRKDDDDEDENYSKTRRGRRNGDMTKAKQQQQNKQQKKQQPQQRSTRTALNRSVSSSITSSSSTKSPRRRSLPTTPVDRTLRNSLGKTRLQTLCKSPRLIITPLEAQRQRRRGPSFPLSPGRRRRRQQQQMRGGVKSSSNNNNNQKQQQQSPPSSSPHRPPAAAAASNTSRKKLTFGKKRDTTSPSAADPKTQEEEAEETEEEEETTTRRATTKKTATTTTTTTLSKRNTSLRTNSKNTNTKQKQKKKEEPQEQKNKKEVKNTKQTATKKQGEKVVRQKARSAPPPRPEVVEIEDKEDAASVSSNSSDISIGPSASVIFEINAAAAEAAGLDVGEALEGEGEDGGRGRRRAPRTLRERRARDAALQRMADLVQRMEEVPGTGRGGAANDDDDPVAQLISSNRFQPLPQEWCDHRKWMRGSAGSRKRRRPSSSDGTASPSGCSALSDGGHEDATSSVATPQLLMRRPDPKQVQSYLQRLRAMNSKPHRPTRKVRADRQFSLPDMDYSQAFRNDSSCDSGSESPVDSDWEG